MPEYEWISFEDALPPSNEAVLLFSPNMHLDPTFPGHSFSVSNPDYARTAAEHGYSHWCRIVYPLPVTVPDGIDWKEHECRYYYRLGRKGIGNSSVSRWGGV